MEAHFWHQKWERGEIGFHQGQVNPLLAAHFATLALPPGSRVFLPLCGKTLDIAWLLAQGYRVVGVELSKIAIDELFVELGVTPTITSAGTLSHYQAESIDILVGNIFAVTAERLGPVDGIYDRAALVALPDEIRSRYAAHLIALTAAAPQLLITFDYDQEQMDGPPFAVLEDDIRRLLGASYRWQMLERKAVVGGLKGTVAAMEVAWWLQRS